MGRIEREKTMENIFNTLNAVNVNGHTEKKNNLTYLSWAWAWAEVKKVYPTATYSIRQFDGKPFLYDENLGYMVMTEMTINGLTHEMWLPVMDNKNKAMKDEAYEYEVKNKNFKYAKLNKEDGRYYDSYGKEQTEYIYEEVRPATMFDINTSIMRCLTKNIAMFGLGLYIYAGEDLPEEEKAKEEPKEEPKAEPIKLATEPQRTVLKNLCEKHKVDIDQLLKLNNLTWQTLSADDCASLLISMKKKFGEK